MTQIKLSAKIVLLPSKKLFSNRKISKELPYAILENLGLWDQKFPNTCKIIHLILIRLLEIQSKMTKTLKR